jgi:UDP-2,3-diacylglucosamine pyrophosphatase LpxH
LTFRDEYIRLADDTSAEKFKKNCLTIEEFFKRKLRRVKSEQFSEEERQIKIHGHCHQNHLVQ